MQQLYENAATIPSSLSGYVHGHIGLVMEPTLYSSFSATAYDAPSAPTGTTLPGNTSSQVSAYLGATSKDVLDHLMDRYMQIKPADLVENGVNYNKTMDISQQDNAYFAQIDDCIQYASDGKTPYTSKQIITT
eukprot:615223-Ditylum_brightwellii.AAC.1